MLYLLSTVYLNNSSILWSQFQSQYSVKPYLPKRSFGGFPFRTNEGAVEAHAGFFLDWGSCGRNFDVCGSESFTLFERCASDEGCKHKLLN